MFLILVNHLLSVNHGEQCTCLQRLHLLQGVDLLPQLLDLGIHIVSPCSCTPKEKHPQSHVVNRGVRKFSKTYSCGFCVRYLQTDAARVPFCFGVDVQS